MYITRLASKEIFSPSNKIHRKVGRAKDLSAPLYTLRKLEGGYRATCTEKLNDFRLSLPGKFLELHQDRLFTDLHLLSTGAHQPISVDVVRSLQMTKQRKIIRQSVGSHCKRSNKYEEGRPSLIRVARHVPLFMHV
jgi:hypothetical protein